MLTAKNELENKMITFFNEYRSAINIFQLKEQIKTLLNNPKIDLEIRQCKNIDTLFNINEVYSSFNIDDFSNMVFENITYCNNTNIYLDKAKNKLDDSQIELGFDRLNKLLNEPYLVNEVFLKTSPKGFNLLSCARPRENNKIFIPVMKYDDNYINLLFIYRVYGDTDYYLNTCSVIIDRTNNNIDFHLNNTVKDKEDNSKDKTIEEQPYLISELRFYEEVQRLLSFEMGIKYISHSTNLEKTRENMFKFCNTLNKSMIAEFSQSIDTFLDSELKDQIKKSCGLILDCDFNLESQKKIFDKIRNTYLAEYISSLCDGEDMKFIAAEKKLPGFPTKISFEGVNSSRGRTDSENKDTPLTIEDIFYSLQTDFNLKEELQEWKISWFESNFFENSNSTEVSQTSIISRKNYFYIKIYNITRVNKEMVNFVVGNIKKYLY